MTKEPISRCETQENTLWLMPPHGSAVCKRKRLRHIQSGQESCCVTTMSPGMPSLSFTDLKRLSHGRRVQPQMAVLYSLWA